MLPFKDWTGKILDLAAEGEKAWCYIDFEYNRTNERYVNLVSVALRMFGSTYSIWLHNDRAAQNEFSVWLRGNKDNIRFVSHGGMAESRAFISLGVDPLSVELVDTWAEFKQLQNECLRYQYGRYFDMTGAVRKSVPPHVIKAMNVGKDMRPIGTSLVDAAALFLGVNISHQRKDHCRRLVLEDKAEYTPAEQTEILEYCADDVKYLPELYVAMSVVMMKELKGLSEESLLTIQLERGKQSASMALCESIGIPIDLEAVVNLSNNVDDAIAESIEYLVTNVYPFFEKDKDGHWKQKQSLFENFIKEKGLEKVWPKTPSGDFASDEDTLDSYEGMPEIKALKYVIQTREQLKWFREDAIHGFMSAVDPKDSRLRTWLGPHGTQTDRNAPPSKKFIPAMSNWLRALIRAPKGWAITGVDWSSQEFMIGAVLSKDPKMMAAYRSGDPYVFFAKEAGAIPKDANNAWIKDPSKAPEDVRAKYLEYEEKRNLFKATVLGLQYGMQPKSLARKLTIDTGKEVTEDQARELMNMHKRVFRVYWDWLDHITNVYSLKPLTLHNGWTLFQDNTNGLSVKNFPVQGTGSVIMRKAVIYAQEAGLHVLYPLHDAIYILHEVGDENSIDILTKCMDRAVLEVLGEGNKIRTEAKTFAWNEDWVEKKGKKMYERLKKFLLPKWYTLEQEREKLEKIERERMQMPVKKTRKKKKVEENLTEEKE